MKGRSQRLQTANPPDDWVDDSWIVDCICGVNFDDGEEIVKCDGCGVWVHTRCSRYVKEQELFACDNCKNKNDRNCIEETEVAQFLVELPTKAVRIESNYLESAPAKKRPFKIWTEMPMEEKVHVQGIPGGDPKLFSGLSSVFSQQLWKCSGYVPKKFNFQCKEFPCWDDDKEVAARAGQDNQNSADKGSGDLFSLSRERDMASPVLAFANIQIKGDDMSNGRKAHLKGVKRWEVEDVDGRHFDNGARKEKSLLRPAIIYSGKRKELGMSNDISGKKKVRIIDKDLDAKRRTNNAFEAAFTSTSDAKQLEFYEDRGANSFKTDIRSVKNRNLKDSVAVEPKSDCHIAVSKTDENPKHDIAAIDHFLKGCSAELACDSQDIPAQDKIYHNFFGVNTSVEEATSGDGCNTVPEMKEGESSPADNSDGTSSDQSLDLSECRVDASPETKNDLIALEMNNDKTIGSQEPNGKTEVDDDLGGLVKSMYASQHDTNSLKMLPDAANSTGVFTKDTSANGNGNDLVVRSLQCDVSQNEGELSNCDAQKSVGFSVNHLDHIENRVLASGSSLKVGMTNHAGFHTSLKGSHAAATRQPVVSNSPTALNDEQFSSSASCITCSLASLPQLASQDDSTLHIKRTSSSLPKDQNLTTPSRRRRRGGSQNSEDDEDSKDQTSGDAKSRGFDSQREHFPKGKRRARSSRRLTLRGRAIKDMRSKMNADTLAYDDEASEEDDSQGGREASSGSEDN